MLQKLKRQECLERYPVFPQAWYDPVLEEEQLMYPKVFESYRLTHPSKSFRGHLTVLGTELVRLTAALGTDTVLFLGDNANTWLREGNPHPPFQKAQAYFRGQQIGVRFNGGLQVDRTDLPDVIRHLAWLTRCNAALPCVHFTDEKQVVLGWICQYGILHLDTLNEPADQIVNDFLAGSRLELNASDRCISPWDHSRAIPAR